MEHLRPTLWERTLGTLGLQKRVAMDPQIPAMSGTAGGYAQVAPYDVRSSYSAMAAFPWVWTCAQAIQTDLGGLPLRIERTTGGKVEQIDDHPMLDLLNRPVPSGRSSGSLLRSQIVLDYAIVRDVFIRLDDARKPRMMIRVHPESAKLIVDGAFLPTSYKVGHDVFQVVPHDEMVHIRGPSWMAGPQQVYGTSPIQVLELMLNVEHDAYQNARRSSKRGRPDMVMSPGDGDQPWKAEQANKIQQWVDNWTASRGGVLINPWGMKVSPVSQTLREMEFTGMIDRGTAAQLAVMGVTPTRAGIQAANYATANVELLIYWQNLQGIAKVIDDGLSQIAARLGQPGDRVVHDFTGVPVLQEYKTAALDRVTTHIFNGMDPENAYREEGLDSAANRVRDTLAKALPAPVDATTEKSARYLNAAHQHLRLVGDAGLSADDVPELLRTLEAAGASS